MNILAWFFSVLGGFLMGSAFWTGLADAEFEKKAIEANVGFYSETTGDFEFIKIEKLDSK
jgi:hypothetical protein